MVRFARTSEDTKIDQIMFLSLHFLQCRERDKPVCHILIVRQRTHSEYRFTRSSLFPYQNTISSSSPAEMQHNQTVRNTEDRKCFVILAMFLNLSMPKFPRGKMRKIILASTSQGCWEAQNELTFRNVQHKVSHVISAGCVSIK